MVEFTLIVKLARRPDAGQTRQLAETASIKFISKHTPQLLRILIELQQG